MDLDVFFIYFFTAPLLVVLYLQVVVGRVDGNTYVMIERYICLY